MKKTFENKKIRIPNLLNESIGQLLVTKVNVKKNYGTCRCKQCGKTIRIPLDELIKMKKSRKITFTCGIDGCKYKKTKSTLNKIKRGMRFGELIVIKQIGTKIIKTKNKETKHPVYLCKCSCGKEIEVLGRNLLYGRTKSCGHIRKNNFIDRNNTKSLLSTENGKKLYEVYNNWKKKFNKPSMTFKREVIDKGIKFFPEIESTENPFSRFHTWAIINGFNITTNRIYLDRKNYNKDFDVKNCFWTTTRRRGY